MKQFWAFTTAFLTVLLIGYLEPVFFLAEKPTETAQSGRLSGIHTTVPHEELPASGYAVYIGKDVETFIRQSGNPKEKIKTGRAYELWTSGLTMNDYLEVNARGNKVIAIKASNNDKMIEPFKINMKLADLSDLATIYSNFAFSFYHEAYDVELMEEDMNYRPLAAFDNGSLAVLFFNQRTGGLMVVNYVNKETLLTGMPYQLNEGSPLSVGITQLMTFDPVQSDRVIYVMNLVKQQENQAIFSVSTQSQKDAQTLCQTLANHISTILSANRQTELLQTREEHTATRPFHLTRDEFSLLIKMSKLSLREPAGIFQESAYNSTFTILSWLSDPQYDSCFAESETTELGVAFSSEGVLVLLEKRPENRQITEGNEKL